MKVDASASNNFTTVAELAALWRCSPQHVYNLIQRGDLKAFRVGGRLIIARSSAQDFLQNGATAQAAAA
jgi:excisionase family DNA binding protein